MSLCILVAAFANSGRFPPSLTSSTSRSRACTFRPEVLAVLAIGPIRYLLKLRFRPQKHMLVARTLGTLTTDLDSRSIDHDPSPAGPRKHRLRSVVKLPASHLGQAIDLVTSSLAGLRIHDLIRRVDVHQIVKGPVNLLARTIPCMPVLTAGRDAVTGAVIFPVLLNGSVVRH